MTVTAQPSDIYYDPYDHEIDADPHPVWRRMREEAPVYWNEKYGFYALSRFDDVWKAYLDPRTFSSTHGVELENLDHELPEPRLMIFTDPPEHDAMRKLVSRAFTPRRIADLEDSIRSLCGELLDPFLDTGGFDYVADFGSIVPPMVIGALLDVPLEERDQLRHWFDEMLHREDGVLTPPPSSIEASIAVHRYAGELVQQRRKAPGDDLISALLTAEIDLDGEPRVLTDLEIQNFLVLLAGAGTETVARLLSWAAVTFARNPEQQAKVAANPGLVPGAVEELLRYEAPSPVNGRYSLADSEFQGVRIPAGSKVLMLNGSANRDPREFDRPDEFDVERRITRHISLGYGTHFCLGASLARLEARVALEETFARIPAWDVVDEGLEMVRTNTVRGYAEVPIRF
ncbi:MAG: cytochrome P450 [Acidimicrobiia bacterium]